jgi:D-alanyl-D-alanine-carboxypeptidase/D-alanyl-D-alanine-endopeptidase
VVAPPSLAPAASPVAAPAPPSLSGIWLGALHYGGKELRLQIHLDLAQTPPSCAFDSLDQGGMGIPCTNVVASATSLSLDVPVIGGTLAGPVSADGNTVNAIWTQAGTGLALVLTRQAKAIEAPKAALDPAIPPVDIEKIQSLLDADLAGALATGDLAPATGGGVTIGVVGHGVRHIFSYGAAKPDSLFEIGSVSKTFTGLLLAQMTQQKKVHLDEPVRALLPAGTVAAPGSGAEITLVDLSAQRSGLPRMPDNFKPADDTNPYADYDAKALYAFVTSYGVALPAKLEVGYSNLGVGLLGQALANRAGVPYEALLHKEITGPLAMRDTAITLTPPLRARFLVGHDAQHRPASAWDFAALAGCGGIRSTAADMLTYLEAQLHPDHLPAAVRATAEGKTLAAAIAASHALQADAGDGMHIALNWFRYDETGSFWHNGATGGYSAFALFNPEKDVAAVVLFNTTVGGEDFADAVGRHIIQRLTGRPAISLTPAAH